MKSKKTTYLLLLLVALVWAGVVYRVFFEGKAVGENVTAVDVAPAKEDGMQQIADTFGLLANYSDPFLERALLRTGGSYITAGAPKRREERRPPPPTPAPAPTVKWPEIKYNGFISGSGSDVALLVIDKSNHLLAKSETAQGITVLAVYGDSVRLSYQGAGKTIYK